MFAHISLRIRVTHCAVISLRHIVRERCFHGFWKPQACLITGINPDQATRGLPTRFPLCM